jgi:hypothetical protein
MLPLVSYIAPANVSDGAFLKPMIRYVQNQLSLPIDIIVGDMGYISSKRKMYLRQRLNIALLTRVRGNMQPLEKFIDYGCPECPEGIPLCWDGYNAENELHCYISPYDNPVCKFCWLNGNCYQEVYLDSKIDEHRFGIIPFHTRVAQKLIQKIRPQVERGFDNDKNKLYLNRFFINSLKLAKILGYLSDTCQVLFLLSDLNTKTKSKAKRMMKKIDTQMSFDF